MSFARDDLATTIKKTRADLEARFQGGGVYRRHSVLGAVATVFALGDNAAHSHIDWGVNQCFPEYCDQENLEKIGARFGMTYLPAKAASGQIIVSGNVGAELAVDRARWQSGDGSVYVLAAGVVLSSDPQTLTVTCDTVGEAGNVEPGATLTLINPVTGVELEATVGDDGITGGAPVESLERFRARVVKRYKQAPHGGAGFDYETWAREAHPDVDRVWVSEELGPGTVSVRFTVYDNGDGVIPSDTVVDIVTAYITARSRRPLGAHIYVMAPVLTPLNFSIDLTPDTPETRAAVTAALRDLINREGGATNDAGDGGCTILHTHMDEAISTAEGEFDHDMTVPAGNAAFSIGELPQLGVITWL